MVDRADELHRIQHDGRSGNTSGTQGLSVKLRWTAMGETVNFELGDLIRPAIRTFFGAPAAASVDDVEAQVAFLGVPSEQGTTTPFIRSGASSGPRLVREVRGRLRDYKPDGTSAGWFDIETERQYLDGLSLVDCGDVLLAPGDVQLSHARISEATRKIAERGALVAVVGGDHSISYPVGRGVADVYGTIDVVHIDAHPDFSDTVFGSKYSHGSQLRRLAEMPTIGKVTALGLRASDREQFDDMKRLGVGFASTRAILEDGPAAVVDRLVPSSNNLYVSIDIDVLEGALVPATTFPEPGGIDFRQLRGLLEAIARKGRVVGFDIVEIGSAQLDLNTASTSAWLITHLLTAIFDPAQQSRPSE
jgi:agmatinase